MTLLQVDKVNFGYDDTKPILHDVSLDIAAGDTIGLVGESGSGKTTLLRLLLGLERPSRGKILFEGQPLDASNRAFMRKFRRQAQVVFQDPYSSLDPRQKIGSIIAEPLRSLRVEGNHREMVAQALESVGLERTITARYPNQFSGGQRQRIAIARAIVARPSLLLADEAVSALDLTTRIRIVELLSGLTQKMSLVLVSHDIGVVAALCRRIVILEKGRIVEQGQTADILRAPSHPYTKRLLASVPRLSIKDQSIDQSAR